MRYLILILILKSPNVIAISKVNNRFNIENIYKQTGLALIIILSIIGASRAVNLFRNPNRDPQIYEVVANKLIYKYNTKNLFCDNYFDLCMSISYINKDKNFNVEIINNNEEMAPYRNYGSLGKVQKAYNEGLLVYSLVRENILSPNCKIEEIISISPESTKYFLVKGKYSEC